MKVEFLCYGTLMSNCWVIVEEGEAIVVDAGAEAEEMKSELEKRHLTPKAILLTHGHFDHAFGAKKLSEKLAIPIYIHQDDSDMLSSGIKNAYVMCYGKEINLGRPDILLKDGDEISLKNEKIKVLHTPGHSPGSICCLAGESLITGDTLFATSVGRWDLYGGSKAALRESLLKLKVLDENLMIYTGHGQSTRLKNALERAFNIV